MMMVIIVLQCTRRDGSNFFLHLLPFFYNHLRIRRIKVSDRLRSPSTCCTELWMFLSWVVWDLSLMLVAVAMSSVCATRRSERERLDLESSWTAAAWEMI